MAERPSMTALPEGYNALVVGASGAIGGAVAAALEADPRAGRVERMSRSAEDFAGATDEQGLAATAARLKETAGALHLVFVATGGLVIGDHRPEKTLDDLAPDRLAAQFALNAVLPALVLKHFHALSPRKERSFFAALSARVGSIGDNRLGGWYGYRAAKAALNQLLHGAAIEIARRRPEAVVAALHPGTVESPLSRPFRPEGAARPEVMTPEESAGRLLAVLNGLTPARSGGFWDWRGEEIAW